MRLIGSGLIIIPPNPKTIFSNDKYFKYRPNSNIFYFSGITQEETVIILDVSENKSYLFLLDRDEQRELWDGKRIDHIEAGEKAGFMMVYPRSEFSQKLRDLMSLSSELHYPSGINNKLDDEVLAIASEYNIKIYDPTQRFHTLRLVKDQYEIELIRKSIGITVDAHIEAIQQTEIGMAEYEIEAIYQSHFRYNGAILPMHQAIVAAGRNGIFLHHMASDKVIEENDLILVDTGCEYRGYTSDIARTWPASGKFTDAQRELYQLVLETHKECLNMVEPGVKFWDIHNYAVKLLTEGMINLGLLDGKLDENIENEKFKKFFPHTIGHFLGLDGHDCSTIDRKSVTLQPSMYITIEPGIYVPDEEGIPDKYKNIGIRIEDNVLITSTGFENLSDSLPIELEEIEELVGSSID